MREYLQIVLLLPEGIFFLLKWTSIIWGPVSIATPFIYKKVKGKELSSNTKFLKVGLFSLYCVTRFAMSASNLPFNRPDYYQVNVLEASSFIFTLLYSGFFFLDQKKCFIKRLNEDRFSLTLGTIILLEGAINLLSLYLQGYKTSF